MRKYIGMIAVMLSLVLLASCAKDATLSNSEETDSATPSEIAQTEESVMPTDEQTTEPSEEPSDAPTPSPEPTSDANDVNSEYTFEECKEIYKNFLTENYQALHEGTSGGIRGLGFLDLDFDGNIEMIAFDGGASAAMGVEIFDIVDGAVECITASMVGILEEFGGENSTKLYINCNYFEDFRLMENHDDSKRFFAVTSSNGATDFQYSELIRFGSNDGVLTLSQVTYKRTEYDVDLDVAEPTVLAQEFQVNQVACDEPEFVRATEEYYTSNADTGLEARGVFGWEKPEYTGDFDSFMKLVDAAFSLAEQNQEILYASYDE